MFTVPEAEKLDHLFSKVEDRDEALYLEEFHGFLYGLAITPELIMPSEWYPEVFGPNGPVFDDDDEAQDCMKHLMDIYNRLMMEGNRGKLHFPFNYDKMSDDEFELIEGWTYGLFLALCLRPHFWGVSDEYADMRDEDFPPGLIDVIDACEVITAVALPEERDEIFETLPGQPQKTDEEIEDILYGMLPACFEIVREHGEKLRSQKLKDRPKPAGDGSSFHSKVGRNDACPCGSGKKYKKCCGAN